MNNNEGIKKIAELLEINPGLPVKFFVDGETVLDPSEYQYTEQQIVNVEVTVWWQDESMEGLILTDASKIKDRLWDMSYSCPDIDTDNEEERERYSVRRWNNEVMEVILVKLSA